MCAAHPGSRCGPLRAASSEALHLPCLPTKGERPVQGQAGSSLPSAGHRDYSNPLSKWPWSWAFTTSVSHDCGFETELQQCGYVVEGDTWAVMPSVQGSTGSALGGEGLRGCPGGRLSRPLTSLAGLLATQISKAGWESSWSPSCLPSVGELNLVSFTKVDRSEGWGYPYAPPPQN